MAKKESKKVTSKDVSAHIRQKAGRKPPKGGGEAAAVPKEHKGINQLIRKGGRPHAK